MAPGTTEPPLRTIPFQHHGFPAHHPPALPYPPLHPSSLRTPGCPLFWDPHPSALPPEQRITHRPKKLAQASPKKLTLGTTLNPRVEGRKGVRRCWLGQQKRCKVLQLGPPQNKVIFNLGHLRGQHRSGRSSAATATSEEVAGQGHQCQWLCGHQGQWLCGHQGQHRTDVARAPRRRRCSCSAQRRRRTLRFPTQPFPYH